MSQELNDLAFELRRRGMSATYFKAQKKRGMSAEEILAAWPPRQASNHVGSRRFRRRFVIATYAAWLVIAAVVKVLTLTNPKWSTSAFLAFTALGVADSIIGLVWFTRRTYINTPTFGDDDLDERLVQIKNHAFRRAYQFVVPLAIMAWVWSMAILLLKPDAQAWTNVYLVFFGVALLATTLPTAIVAWREPDPAEPEPLSS